MLKCEICGSTNFYKENGEFKCRGCGMAYTLHEISKMSMLGEPVSKSAESQSQQNNVRSDSISVDAPSSQTEKKFMLHTVKAGGFNKDEVNRYIKDLISYYEWLKNEKNRSLNFPDTDPEHIPEFISDGIGFFRTSRKEGYDKQDVLAYVDKIIAAINQLEIDLDIAGSENDPKKQIQGIPLPSVKMSGFNKQETLKYIDSLMLDIAWLEREVNSKKGNGSPNRTPRKVTDYDLSTVTFGGFDAKYTMIFINRLKRKIIRLEEEL